MGKCQLFLELSPASICMLLNLQRGHYNYYKILKHCIVCGSCEHKLFQFPIDEKFSEIWRHNLKHVFKEEINNIEKPAVCEQHFEEQYFRNGAFLKYNAIPTLKLGNREDPIIDRIPTYHAKRCLARTCKHKKYQINEFVRFFKFPDNEDIRQIWIEILKVVTKRKCLFACHLHFEKKYWSKGRQLPAGLLPIPVPDEELGSSL